MQDEQRFNLLFGPYHPPKTRRGKFLFCEMRGTVKVGDYSDGPIPWPVKWGTRNSLILCGDLVRAVQVESAQGVAHHWGVRASTVTRYRKALQVERDTTGTRQLYRGNFQERLLPQANRLGAVFARRPRIRVKIFRRLVNQPLHAKVRAVFRALIQHPNSRKLQRRLFQTIRQHGWPRLEVTDWAPEEDKLLGTKPDLEIARLLGRSHANVMARRQGKDIPYREPQLKPWKPRHIDLLGTANDEQIARRLGRSVSSVRAKRENMGIPVFDPQLRPWTKAEEEYLGTKPDIEVAKILGRTRAAVQIRRYALGIPPCWKNRRIWTPKEEALLGTMLDHELAKKLGRSLGSVRSRRHSVTSIRFVPGIARWPAREVRLLGTRSDEEVAKRIGRTVQAVRAKRVKLKIPGFIRERTEWTDEEEHVLGTMPDREAAKQLGRTVGAVRTHRSVKRIPAYRPTGRKSLPA